MGALGLAFLLGNNSAHPILVLKQQPQGNLPWLTIWLWVKTPYPQ